jgi:hypothetical protein
MMVLGKLVRPRQFECRYRQWCYIYRAYLETLLIYGHDISHSHLMNAFWFRNNKDFLAKDLPSDA